MLIFYSGLEIDCTWEHLDLHVPGYGIDHTDPAFKRLGDDICEQEQASGKLELIEAHTGLHINRKLIAEKAPNGVVTGELIAEIAMADPKNHSNPFLKPYLEGGERSNRPYVNFYWYFFSKGKPAYTEILFISLQEAISLIESTGGVPVLAHPSMNLKADRKQVFALIDVGIKGIEVYSSYHSEEDINFYSKVVSYNKLLMTCGSDFHGKNKPDIVIAEFGKALEYDNMLTALKQATTH